MGFVLTGFLVVCIVAGGIVGVLLLLGGLAALVFEHKLPKDCSEAVWRGVISLWCLGVLSVLILMLYWLGRAVKG